MARGRRSGIAFGQRTKQNGQSDLDMLIRARQHLLTRWHLNFHREWYIGFDRESGEVRRITESVDRSEANNFRWRNPDLMHIHKTRGVIVIEIDGSVHDSKTAKTERRNKEYELGHIKLITINLSDIRSVGRTMEEEIDWKMTKLLSGAVIGTG